MINDTVVELAIPPPPRRITSSLLPLCVSTEAFAQLRQNDFPRMD